MSIPETSVVINEVENQTSSGGLVKSITGTWSGTFGYAGAFGYQEDADSGLKLLGNRYYDTSLGRFLSRDPIKDGSNWYSYCGGNPVSNSDQLGFAGKGTDKGRGDDPFYDLSADELQAILDDPNSIVKEKERARRILKEKKKINKRKRFGNQGDHSFDWAPASSSDLVTYEYPPSPCPVTPTSDLLSNPDPDPSYEQVPVYVFDYNGGDFVMDDPIDQAFLGVIFLFVLVESGGSSSFEFGVSPTLSPYTSPSAGFAW